MFLVFSSLFDPHVTPGVEHLRKAGADVKVLTCHDLARPGWRLSLAEEPTLVVEGKRVPARRIRGVLTRLAWVTHHELPFLRAEDREYGAAEMQAFLLALLDRLSCPVLNRATPGSLNGPGWSPERWTRCAAELGLAVQPIVRRTYAGGAVLARPAAPSRRILQVVGKRVLGDAPQAFHDAARALADAAGCALLRVAFAARTPSPEFVGADPFVDLSDAEVATAVLEALQGKGRRS
ncbi:MAG: hypothetical protein DIU78_011875 [Pseudomonadota bacterium]|nr:MAG: hypothetical protein DIU78_23135 [Pseudomonadota bacterium]